MWTKQGGFCGDPRIGIGSTQSATAPQHAAVALPTLLGNQHESSWKLRADQRVVNTPHIDDTTRTLCWTGASGAAAVAACKMRTTKPVDRTIPLRVQTRQQPRAYGMSGPSLVQPLLWPRCIQVVACHRHRVALAHRHCSSPWPRSAPAGVCVRAAVWVSAPNLPLLVQRGVWRAVR